MVATSSPRIKGRWLVLGGMLLVVVVALAAAGIWSRRGGVQILNQQAPMRSLAYAPSGPLLAAGDGFGNVTLWDSERQQALHALDIAGDLRDVNAVAFSADGAFLVAGRDAPPKQAGRVELWDVARAQRVRSWAIGPDAANADVLALAFSPDGQTVAVGALSFVAGESAQSLFLLDPRADAAPRRVATPNGTIWTLAFTPDGTLVSGDSDGNVALWDVVTGTMKRSLGGHRGIVGALTVSRDGRRLASAGDGGEIVLWELPAGTTTQRIATGSAVEALAFAPDGARLVAGDEARMVRLWAVSSSPATALQSWGPLGWEVIGVAYRADGRQLAAITGGDADSDYVIRLWTAPE